mgnify:CR=1 FL=1
MVFGPDFLCSLFFDGADDDRRVDFGEFKHGLRFVALNLSEQEARAEFAKIDAVGLQKKKKKEKKEEEGKKK